MGKNQDGGFSQLEDLCLSYLPNLSLAGLVNSTSSTSFTKLKRLYLYGSDDAPAVDVVALVHQCSSTLERIRLPDTVDKIRIFQDSEFSQLLFLFLSGLITGMRSRHFFSSAPAPTNLF